MLNSFATVLWIELQVFTPYAQPEPNVVQSLKPVPPTNPLTFSLQPWLPTKSLYPPPHEHPEGFPFQIPPTPRFPEQLECVTLTVMQSASEDAAPTSVSALRAPFACLSPAARSHRRVTRAPCHLVKQQHALTHGRSSRSTRCCSSAPCAITRSGRLSTIKGGPFAFPANPSVLAIKSEAVLVICQKPLGLGWVYTVLVNSAAPVMLLLPVNAIICIKPRWGNTFWVREMRLSSQRGQDKHVLLIWEQNWLCKTIKSQKDEKRGAAAWVQVQLRTGDCRAWSPNSGSLPLPPPVT